MSSSAKKGGTVGVSQKSDKSENSSNLGSGSKGDSLSTTPSKGSKHGVTKKAAGANHSTNKNNNADFLNNPTLLNQQQNALESLYSATYVEDFIDCNESMSDDMGRQTTRMFEMGSNYMTYIRELESAMAILLGEGDSDRIPDQLSSDKKKAVFRLQQVLMTSQDTGDDSLQVMQSIQDYLENKTRQLDIDRKNLAEFCKEHDLPDTPFKDPPPPPTERNIKRARRQRHEIYRPSILGPSSLKATSYPEAVSSNTREHHQDGHVATTSRSRDRESREHQSSTNQASCAGNSQSSSDGSNAGTNEDHKPNGRSSERTGASSTRHSTSNSADRGDRDHSSSSADKGGSNSGSGNTSSSSSKKQSQKNQTQDKRTKKRKAKQGSGSKDDNSPQQYQIDPDEPTYCLCDQVSFGEMIGCDNDLCPIEWFHFSCVSLTTKPKGKWFCPKCRGDRPNCMKPRHIFLKELEKYNREKEEKA